MSAGAPGPEVRAETDPGYTLRIPVVVTVLMQSISTQMVTSFCQDTVCGELIAAQLVSRSPFACTVEAT